MHSSLETYDKVPAFLYKLWKLVEDKSTDHLIRWQEDGKSFILYKQGQFSRELLPQYYKHNNMASFVRQLNMYGFRKVPSMEGGGLRLERDEMEFAHPCFVRGQEHQLEFIKRKMTSGRGATVGGGAEESRMAELMSEVAALHRKQETLITQMNNLRRENSDVWTRYCDIDHKLQMQNNIIEKLTRFVVSVLKPKGMNVNLTNVRRLPQIQALFAGHSMVPALTQGSSRSPLSDGPVIHEVVDDVFSSTDTDSVGTVPTQPVPNTSDLQQQPLPTSSGIQPILSPVTTTITEHGTAGPSIPQRCTVVSPPTVSNNRVASYTRLPSDAYSVVGGGSGAAISSETLLQQQQQQSQRQQQLFTERGNSEDVYITPHVDHLPPQGLFHSNPISDPNFVSDFGNPAHASSDGDLAVNCNPIVESPKGTLLSDGEPGVADNSSFLSAINTPSMARTAGLSTNSSAVLSNATLFVGDNTNLTHSSYVQNIKDNFSANDVKLRRGVTQTKTNSATATTSHNGTSGFNPRVQSTFTFTVGPNNTLIPTKNRQMVLNSNDGNVFTGVPIKQEIVLNQPLLTLASSSTTTTTAPFLTKSGKQQHIVTNVSVIPNTSRVSITNISNGANKTLGSSSGRVQPAITNTSQNSIILDNNVLSTKRAGVQNNRITGGKKTLFQVKNNNNNNASSSTGNNFNNTISTMGNIVPLQSSNLSNSDVPSVAAAAKDTSFNSNNGGFIKRVKGITATNTSLTDSSGAGTGGVGMPVFKVVRKTPQQQPLQQPNSTQHEGDTVASDLVAAAADLLSPSSSSTDVVSLSNTVSRGGGPASESLASALSLDLGFVEGSGAGTSSDVALPSSSGQAYPSRDDMNKQLEDMSFLLDNVQGLFKSGHLERDESALYSHIFNPELPLSDFELLTGFDSSSIDPSASSSYDSLLQPQQQQLALYNNPSPQDLTALLDSPSRLYMGTDDEQPFEMASLDSDLMNTPHVASRSPPRKRLRTAAPSLKKEPRTEDEEALDPFLRNLYSGSSS